MDKRFHLAERECVAEAIEAAARASTLEELYSEIEKYEGHDVAKREHYTPSQTVDFDSPIMIVTEKPEPQDKEELSSLQLKLPMQKLPERLAALPL